MNSKSTVLRFPKPMYFPAGDWREPKGSRGAVVIEKVTSAAVALLSAKSSRDITVVDIAKKADVARASLLLQFPDGMRDILATIANREYREICAAETSLWEANPPKTPVESVCRLLDAIHLRAHATGRLYGNLMAEALQNLGGHRDELGGTFGIVSVCVVVRAGADLPQNKYLIDGYALALGEMLCRSAWGIATAGWAIPPVLVQMRQSTPSPADITNTLALAVVPLIRAHGRQLGAGKSKGPAKLSK
jgi:AcrR family transcriptional regulator